MRPESNKTTAATPDLTAQEFAHLGDGSLAYVKTIDLRCSRLVVTSGKP